MLDVEEAVYRILDIAPYLYNQPIDMWKALQGKYKFSKVREVCQEVEDKIIELIDDPKYLKQFATIEEAMNHAEKKKFEERKERRK